MAAAFRESEPCSMASATSAAHQNIISDFAKDGVDVCERTRLLQHPTASATTATTVREGPLCSTAWPRAARESSIALTVEVQALYSAARMVWGLQPSSDYMHECRFIHYGQR